LYRFQPLCPTKFVNPSTPVAAEQSARLTARAG
jgi:hypothetical protein